MRRVLASGLLLDGRFHALEGLTKHRAECERNLCISDVRKGRWGGKARHGDGKKWEMELGEGCRCLMRDYMASGAGGGGGVCSC